MSSQYDNESPNDSVFIVHDLKRVSKKTYHIDQQALSFLTITSGDVVQ